jgi:hypothetical protein
MANDKIVTLRVELEGISPLIWRRFAVPAAIRLDSLHRVIQAVMGWQDRHLWMITADDHRYGIILPADDDWNERITNAATVQLASVVSVDLKEISYVYDFGDNWEHRVVIESIGSAVSPLTYPQFLGGERRCPPEDCGGIPGYYEFLEKISAKAAKKREAAFAWYGGPYDPDDIEEQNINHRLRNLSGAI